MKKILYSLVIVLAMATVAVAQDFKFVGGYMGTDFHKNPASGLNSEVKNLKTVFFDVDGKIVDAKAGVGTFRLGGIFAFQREFDSPVGDGVNRDVNSFAGGVGASYKIGFVEPGGAVLYGGRKKLDNLPAETFRRYRAYIDVRFGKESRFGIRPFIFEREATGSFGNFGANKFGAGLFFNTK